ncbi:helix-turn-helix domain-containing protein, partial [Pseudomonas helleri]|nr:helix-turn-helix domain-containing protein [Pseudomonas helleri]
IVHARRLIEEEGRPVTEAARILNVHRATLYRALARPPA